MLGSYSVQRLFLLPRSSARSVQRQGTARIGRLFGPVMAAWFLVIGLLGLLGLVRHPAVLWALDPREACPTFFPAAGRRCSCWAACSCA